jgi:AraC family transcriptional regulator, transcriptional activator of pobA
MPSARRAIRSLPFRHAAKPQLGIEVFRLSDLYARADRRALDHALETPQRPEFHTIYVGLRGRGTIVIDFAPVTIGAEHVTVVARGRVQQFVVERGVDAWLVVISPEFVGSGGDDPLRAPGILAPASAVPAIRVPAREHAELLAIVDQLVAEQARPLDNVQPAIQVALTRVLLMKLERLHGGSVTPLPSAVERFFTILERDHAKTRSVAHYARAAGISARRLGELLDAHVGKTTKQVIDERVVLEQQRLLAHTEISVKELASRTGFDEPTNLVKFFRHHTRQTPLEFRASHRTFLPSRRRS